VGCGGGVGKAGECGRGVLGWGGVGQGGGGGGGFLGGGGGGGPKVEEGVVREGEEEAEEEMIDPVLRYLEMGEEEGTGTK